MPPHCDSLDGPVVTAARDALESEEVARVLPYVPVEAEGEVKAAFDRAGLARAQGREARDVADLWFFETVVRLHRAGEGAPYTGLKPAGLDVGPVIPVAEQAIADGDAGPLVDLLTSIVREETEARLRDVVALEAEAAHGSEAARAYVSAMLGLQVWAHGLARAAHAHPHGEGHEHHG